jgi:hypothetical protein
MGAGAGARDATMLYAARFGPDPDRYLGCQGLEPYTVEGLHATRGGPEPDR